MFSAELRNISKTYPGASKKANNNISINIKKGEIFCLAGENGAGKTTLMKILCGLEKQDEGEIYINEKKTEIKSVIDARKNEIGMVHQHFMLFSEYTAAENIVMGTEPKKYGVFFDSQKAIEIADKLIKDNNFSLNSRTKVSELTLGERQQVEICRILYQNAQIIILDEPTSILTEYETLSLFKTLKKLVNTGKSIILITHKINEIKQISDRVAILRRGELAGVFNIDNIDENKIAEIMIYEEKISNNFRYSRSFDPFVEKKIDEPVIKFDNVTVIRQGQKRPLLDKVSFFANSKEILGFAGVGGNGLGVIEAVLGGFLHPVSGKIFHKGKDITQLSIRALRNQGLAYVPADRIRVGSAVEATIEENIIINRRQELIKDFRNKKKSMEYSKNIIEKYNIDTQNSDDKASTLSGGNLQKLILAREINWFNDYIVFSEPTWGLDITSSNYIKSEIDLLRKQGAAVILISTNLDEIIALADRIIVMFCGKVAGVFVNEGETVKEKIGKCMFSMNNEPKVREQ